MTYFETEPKPSKW